LLDLFTTDAALCCMHYIKANHRSQIKMNCLEEQIAADHQVRFIDVFVGKLDLAAWKKFPDSCLEENSA